MHAAVAKVFGESGTLHLPRFRTSVGLAFVLLATLATSAVVRGQSAPTANAGGPYRIDLGQGVTVNGSASSDPNGDIVGYNWDFLNNGSTDITGAIASPTWANLNSYGISGVGTYPVKLTVVDATALSSSATAQLIVYENIPHAVASASTYTALFGQTINFSGTGSYTDRFVDRSIVSYNWDFGDATIASGVTPTHVYSQLGVFNVSLTVGDNNVPQKTNTTAFNITVVPEPTSILLFGWMVAFALMCSRSHVRS